MRTMIATRSAGARIKPAEGPTAGDVKIADLDNDSLIVRLHFTVNHLSRWLTPIHDRGKLERSLRRGEPSIKELLIRMRDEEQRIFPKMHAIAMTANPDLDKAPIAARTARQEAVDAALSPLSTMAEFRRLRQSTCSLLRSLPDSAWVRVGISRKEHDWQVRSLAEHLANRDLDALHGIDLALDRTGAREGVNEAAKVHLDELLRLTPVSTRSR